MKFGSRGSSAALASQSLIKSLGVMDKTETKRISIVRQKRRRDFLAYK